MEVGDLAQQLRVNVILAEDSNSITSTHITSPTTCNFCSRVSDIAGFLRNLHSHASIICCPSRDYTDKDTRASALRAVILNLPMLRPFNILLHVVVTPNHKIILVAT